MTFTVTYRGARCALAVLAIFLAGTLPFMRTAGYGLVNLDDYGYAVQNPVVKDGASFAVLKWGARFRGEGILMPLTWFSFSIDFSVAKVGERLGLCRKANEVMGAEEPVYRVMHFHSVLLHGLNAVLLWWLILAIFNNGRAEGGIAVALVAAMAWAVHPMRCESVAWIASRKDVLSMAWLLAALILWVRSRGRGGLKGGAYCASVACFGLASAAKPSAMVFPGLCFVLDAFFIGAIDLRRIAEAAKGRAKGLGAMLHEAFSPYMTPVFMSVCLAIFAQDTQAVAGATKAMEGVGLAWKLLNAAVSYGVYALNTVCPHGLSPHYMARMGAAPRWMVAGLLAFAALAVTLAVALRRRDRCVAGGLLWFFGAMFPMIGLSGFGFHALADRFTYIPAIGFSIILAGWLVEMRGGTRRLAFAAVAVWCAAMGYVAWRYCGTWKDDGTFLRRIAAEDSPHNPVAASGMLCYLFEYRHGDPEIVKWAENLLDMPNFTPCAGSGDIAMWVLCEAGRMKDARRLLGRMAEWDETMRPEGANGHYLAFMEARALYFAYEPGMMSLAEDAIAVAMQKMPKVPTLWWVKGVIAKRRGDDAGAKAAWRKIHSECKAADAAPYVNFSWISKEGEEI